MRIGQGYDAHRFELGKPLVLGGVRVEHDAGLLAHSDGDVLIHAVCDALLGAAALGDIGQHFSDQDAAFENIDSRVLLRKVVELIAENGFAVGNVDSTIVAQKPKLATYVLPMREVLAQDLKVPVSSVSIKATTTEKMGFTGRGEGIAAQAIVLLVEAT
ncbi:MAG: 2-C-methyl-D-erythritol 2,4-cyclodiphosphate synthase [Methylococcales bacterium]|nr:2-C-methyl-D-erythritol 2,4-cyclodiphosphate synthase [Methylococcales bacterium]MBT7445443.1 2-C-methyl-D-erythritol 2,4-cyclodiphosphate synthase [Methylococcales bacterium]